jgi:hypothetical protein
MEHQAATGARSARARWGAALIIGVASFATTAATASAARRDHVLRISGKPVILDSNIRDNRLHHFNPVVKIQNSFVDTQNVTIEFDVMAGTRLLKTIKATAGIRPGGGVVTSDDSLPAKHAYSVKARFISFEPAGVDDALVAAKIVGTPQFVRTRPPACSMHAVVRNPSTKTLDGFTAVDLVALRGGKIVAFGAASIFDDLAPGASKSIDVDFVSCVKVDEVKAYVEGDGI